MTQRVGIRWCSGRVAATAPSRLVGHCSKNPRAVNGVHHRYVCGPNSHTHGSHGHGTILAVGAAHNAQARARQHSTDYVSPLKKLTKTMQQHQRRIVDTIDGFIENNDVTDPNIRASIRIQACVLWVANACIRGLRFLRVYLGEQRAPEPLHEQQTDYQEAQRDDPYQANEFLITLSIYDNPADSPDFPPPGSIIAFVPTKLHLNRDCCQSKLYHIATVTSP